MLHLSSPPTGKQTLVLRLQPLHEQILALLGSLYQSFYGLALREQQEGGIHSSTAVFPRLC